MLRCLWRREAVDRAGRCWSTICRATVRWCMAAEVLNLSARWCAAVPCKGVAYDFGGDGLRVSNGRRCVSIIFYYTAMFHCRHSFSLLLEEHTIQ